MYITYQMKLKCKEYIIISCTEYNYTNANKIWNYNVTTLDRNFSVKTKLKFNKRNCRTKF